MKLQTVLLWIGTALFSPFILLGILFALCGEAFSLGGDIVRHAGYWLTGGDA